mmetsp:Transcript_27060/g.67989  ORF Transcript_27060/g.67989 Transcript_27060/m.67989 type:complete len:244 (+) Transcript_27060:711-1442(+)
MRPGAPRGSALAGGTARTDGGTTSDAGQPVAAGGLSVHRVSSSGGAHRCSRQQRHRHRQHWHRHERHESERWRESDGSSLVVHAARRLPTSGLCVVGPRQRGLSPLVPHLSAQRGDTVAPSLRAARLQYSLAGRAVRCSAGRCSGRRPTSPALHASRAAERLRSGSPPSALLHHGRCQSPLVLVLAVLLAVLLAFVVCVVALLVLGFFHLRHLGAVHSVREHRLTIVLVVSAPLTDGRSLVAE